jgi:ABC-type multidrug transport system fused ATPase/permease subunit
MATCNDFEELRTLDSKVLDEIIREGELRIQAQFSAAAASDQRAMAWAGFMITAAIAAFAAAAALVVTKEHMFLSMVTFTLGVALLLSTAIAGSVVRPQKFGFPGNEPKNWLLDQWMCGVGGPHNMAQARVEQATSLQNQIASNAAWAEEVGRKMTASLDLATAAVLLGTLSVMVRMIFGEI